MPATYTDGALPLRAPATPHPVEKGLAGRSAKPAELAATWFPCSVSYDEFAASALRWRFVFPDEVGAMEMDGEVTAARAAAGLLAFTWGPGRAALRARARRRRRAACCASNRRPRGRATRAARDGRGLGGLPPPGSKQRLAGEPAEPARLARRSTSSYERSASPRARPCPTEKPVSKPLHRQDTVFAAPDRRRRACKGAQPERRPGAASRRPRSGALAAQIGFRDGF